MKQAMVAEMKHLKTLLEAQNIKYEAQQEELAVVKHMVAMIMPGKQPRR
jgi:hypothetical protein